MIDPRANIVSDGESASHRRLKREWSPWAKKQLQRLPGLALIDEDTRWRVLHTAVWQRLPEQCGEAILAVYSQAVAPRSKLKDYQRRRADEGVRHLSRAASQLHQAAERLHPCWPAEAIAAAFAAKHLAQLIERLSRTLHESGIRRTDLGPLLCDVAAFVDSGRPHYSEIAEIVAAHFDLDDPIEPKAILQQRKRRKRRSLADSSQTTPKSAAPLPKSAANRGNKKAPKKAP